MSTTTTSTTRDERPRAGARQATRTESDRWGETASGSAPRQFDPACGHRLPNTCDEANQRV